MENQRRLEQVLWKGLHRAAGAFTGMINRPVRAATLAMGNHLQLNASGEASNDLSMLLVTDVVGEMSARSYLVVRRSQCEHLSRFSRIPLRSAALQEAFALELDNVVSGAVISEISKGLGAGIYGDPPYYIVMRQDECLNFITADALPATKSVVLYCSTSFEVELEHPMTLQFIWKFSSSFADFIVQKT